MAMSKKRRAELEGLKAAGSPDLSPVPVALNPDAVGDPEQAPVVQLPRPAAYVGTGYSAEQRIPPPTHAELPITWQLDELWSGRLRRMAEAAQVKPEAYLERLLHRAWVALPSAQRGSPR